MTTNWHLIRTTPEGFTTTEVYHNPGPKFLESPTTAQLVQALEDIDAQDDRYRKESDVVGVVALPIKDGVPGNPVSLKRCDICGQFKAPGRRHVCKRAHNPREGDVFQRAVVVQRWLGEGSCLDFPQEHYPHLWRTETQISSMTVESIEARETYCWESEDFVTRTTVRVSYHRYDYNLAEGRWESETDTEDMTPWQWRLEAKHWELGIEGTGRDLKEALS